VNPALSPPPTRPSHQGNIRLKLQITMMRDRLLIATVDGIANFSVWNADEQMLVDLLLMVVTYDSLEHVMAGCA
jgi:hypothetical protein